MSSNNPYQPTKNTDVLNSSISHHEGGEISNKKNWLIIKGNGPILITSPHTIATRRRLSIHKREIYVYNIINEIYEILGPKLVTLCTWNVELLDELIDQNGKGKGKGNGNGNGNIPQDRSLY